MTQVAAVDHPDPQAPDRFLCGVERRALQMAELALGRRAAALDAVEDAMRRFAIRFDARAGSTWAALFWSLLDSSLGAPRRMAPVPTPPGPFMQLREDEAIAALGAALRALPQRQRQAFLLRVREDFDAATSARVLRLSESELRVQLVHALRELRTRLRMQPQAMSGTDSHHDGAWILRSRALLDGAARDLDGATLTRLAMARQVALTLSPAAVSTVRGGRWLVRAGGLAIVAGVALALSRLLPPMDSPTPTSTSVPSWPAPEPPAPIALPQPPPRIAPSEDTPLAAPDFDLLLDADDETLLEDLAFYAWLAAEERP